MPIDQEVCHQTVRSSQRPCRQPGKPPGKRQEQSISSSSGLNQPRGDAPGPTHCSRLSPIYRPDLVLEHLYSSKTLTGTQFYLAEARNLQTNCSRFFHQRFTHTSSVDRLCRMVAFVLRARNHPTLSPQQPYWEEEERGHGRSSARVQPMIW